MHITLSELRKKPHLSASSIGDYLSCSLLYKFSRIDRLPISFISDGLLFGSAIHRSLEFFYKGKKEGKAPTVKEVVNHFSHNWTEETKDRDNIRYRKGKSAETLLHDGKNLLETFFKELPDDNFSVLAIEEPFEVQIEGIDVPLIGGIDLIEQDESGTIIVTDWKTSSKRFSLQDVNNNFQLMLYHLAVKSNGYADRDVVLKFDVLIKTKTPQFQQYYTVRDEKDERRAIKKIERVWEGINKNVFIPSPSWLCPYCAYKEYCDDW